jgi:hypothetical protein
MGAHFPDVLVTHIETLTRYQRYRFRFSLSGKSTTEEFSAEAIEDEDRGCDLLNTIRRAVRRIRQTPRI